MNDATTPLLTDLYQLNMIQAYLDHGETKTAVFEFFVRKLPARRGFLVAAGLEQALAFLENLQFSAEEIDWLARSGRFGRRLLKQLTELRFTGDVHAMPEGTVFFANEPILRVTAPLLQAQLLETRLINILHFQSLIASKAARMVLAAPGKLLVDFGLRRAHGAEAGLMAARASVRLDSGDLTALSKSVRYILDDGGLKDVRILASGGLDEDNISEMLRAGAPIDAFGVGTSLTTSSDVPALDCAYKLQEYAELPRRKHSSGKATWPGRKQVWRQYGPDCRMTGDIISIESDKQPGEPLIEMVMQGGRRIRPSPALSQIRDRAAHNLQLLPEQLRHLETDFSYPVKIADALIELTKQVDSRLAERERAYA